jgi:hypothetical protein
MPLADEIEEALSAWFNAEHAFRHSNFGPGHNLREQEDDRDRARRYLAEKLGELGL